MDSLGVRRLLDAAFDSIPAGLIVQDGSGRIVASNRPARKVLGLDATTLHGKDVSDGIWRIIDRAGRALTPDEQPAMRALHTGEAVKGQLLGMRFGDHVSWSFVDCVPLFGDDGAVEGVATFFRDANATVEN